MTEKQPEALHLADCLDANWISPTIERAAAELRRLHSENEELKKQAEPVAWMMSNGDVLTNHPAEWGRGDEAFTPLCASPGGSEPVAEPVAYEWRYNSCGFAAVNRLAITETPEPTVYLKNVFALGPWPLYRHPHPAQQPLTAARIDKLIEGGVFGCNPHEIVRRLEEERGIYAPKRMDNAQIVNQAHKFCKKYRHSNDPLRSHTYEFDRDRLLQFVRAIERAHGIGGGE